MHEKDFHMRNIVVNWTSNNNNNNRIISIAVWKFIINNKKKISYHIILNKRGKVVINWDTNKIHWEVLFMYLTIIASLLKSLITSWYMLKTKYKNHYIKYTSVLLYHLSKNLYRQKKILTKFNKYWTDRQTTKTIKYFIFFWLLIENHNFKLLTSIWWWGTHTRYFLFNCNSDYSIITVN